MIRYSIFALLLSLLPVCSWGMEPGCGETASGIEEEIYEMDENNAPTIGAARCSSDSYKSVQRHVLQVGSSTSNWRQLYGSLSIEWDCGTSTQNNVYYHARNFIAYMEGGEERPPATVQRQTLRIFNGSFNYSKPCNNCDQLNYNIALPRSQNPPLRVNSVHFARHNGVTAQIVLSLPK